MRKIRNLLILILLFTYESVFAIDCYAIEKWNFQKTYETISLSERPFVLITAGDINKNGKKEILTTDFGAFRGDIGAMNEEADYHFLIFEWESNKLEVKLSKSWKRKDFRAPGMSSCAGTLSLNVWEVGDRVIAETYPPYFGVEWLKGEYVFMEQRYKNRTVGSWAFPWQSLSCVISFVGEKWPRECFYGIREFTEKGETKIFTIYADSRSSKRVLRIRRYENGFPIEFEENSGKYDFVFNDSGYIGAIGQGSLSKKAKGGVLFKNFKGGLLYMVKYDIKTEQYKIFKSNFKEIMVDNYIMPDSLIRSSRNKDVEEYWGSTIGTAYDGGGVDILRRVVIKPDLSGLITKDIKFSYHKNFIGVGYFDLQDIDGDGLDEIILVEQTGKRKFGVETVSFSEIQDYLKILKWNGKEYQVMWETPISNKRGTKFLVDDIKGTGKKQIVVFTREGTVQIWERE